MLEYLQVKTSLPGSLCESFNSVLVARATELRVRIMEDASTFAPYYLKDIDWVVKLILASDSASVLRETLLMVTLHLASRDGSKKTIRLELNMKELDTLIERLCKAAEVVMAHSV